MRLRPLNILVVLGLGLACGAQDRGRAAAIAHYLQPYVDSRNFAGAVLVRQGNATVFRQAYGFADRERGARNTVDTRFHVASVSMQFTAGAVLRLVDSAKLSLDDRAGSFVSGVAGADAITVRDLLTQRSGLPDINSLPDYDDVLRVHQTPTSLVAKIAGKQLLFEPGSKYMHEEHSAYNLLALIVEKKEGASFAAGLERLLFAPLGLRASGIDDDSPVHSRPMAKGYQPEGTYELKPAADIHWSAKAGNGSAFTTITDLGRWVDALFNGTAVSAKSRGLVLDTSTRVGYGWFRGKNDRFGETAYYMNGRAPGFASFVLYLPERKLTVVVLSNVYSSATTTIGYDIAALVLGLPYEKPDFGHAPEPARLADSTGTFQFGSDFYQANAQLSLALQGKELWIRWPSGDSSALIPAGKDRFIDRSYWVDVKVERDSSGKPAALVYDGFRGPATPGR